MILLATSALTVAAVGVAAGHGAAREELVREAVQLVRQPYGDFELSAAARRAPFDWSTDGCSRTPAPLARRFAGPCRQHDFAYRNLGRGLRLRPDEATRRWADARFLSELRRRCAELFAGLRLRGCRATARAMWVAVRRFGPRWEPGARARDARARGRCVAPGAAQVT